MTPRQNESGAILIAVPLVLTLLAGITAVSVRGGRNAAQTLEAEDTLRRCRAMGTPFPCPIPPERG